MRFSVVSLLLAFLTLCGLMACIDGGRPKGILSPKQMENVMHDYHLAQVLDKMAEHVDTATVGAVDKVLEKYQLKQGDLDSSLSYYAHHIDQLKKIYKKLNDRYGDEAAELGIHRVSNTGYSFSASGDTLDVWMDSRLAVLSAAPLNRKLEFSVEADTSYYQHDVFQIQGFAHFIARPGEEQKNSISVGMTVVYDNDSVQATARQVNTSQFFSMDLRCDSLYGIKSVYGYISLASKESSPVILENLRLLKMHRKHMLKDRPGAPPALPAVGE